MDVGGMIVSFSYNQSSAVITWYNIVILKILLILPVSNVITENVVFPDCKYVTLS